VSRLFVLGVENKAVPVLDGAVSELPVKVCPRAAKSKMRRGVELK